MIERKEHYDASQPRDWLDEIKADMDIHQWGDVCPVEYDAIARLVSEVERLRQLLHSIYGNTKITLDRDNPRDMVNFLRELEMMTEEWK